MTTFVEAVNLVPQFQQNASPDQERAPQYGQNRDAEAGGGDALIGDGGATGWGGEIARRAGDGG